MPAAYVEAIFRRAPVPDPSSLAPVQMMVKCLGMPEYLDDALDLLIDEGIFKTEDGDGDTVDIVYEYLDELIITASELILSMPDRQELQVNADSFEWLEGYTGGPQVAHIDWFSKVTLENLTERTHDLSVYIDYTLMLGPRSTESIRIDKSSTFYAMIGEGGQGGQLAPRARSDGARGGGG